MMRGSPRAQQPSTTARPDSRQVCRGGETMCSLRTCHHHAQLRTVCHRTFRLGAMRGAGVVTVRFGERPDESALTAAIETLMQDKAVACGEIWQAADPLEFPVSMEERLRGGDRKIEACLLVETLRVPDASQIAVVLANEFPRTEIGVYQLLCEIRTNGL